jgi:CheY-like chemotaxis protein
VDGGVREDAGAEVLTALVVDDSAGARRRTRTVLRLGGWRVTEAVGMTDAVRKAAGLDLDLVVTDMTMRDGNGPSLLWALRDGGCAARFLAVSTDVTAQIRAQATAAGAGACLAKPVDPRELLDFLLDGLSVASAQGRGQAQAALDRAPALRVEAERVDHVREAYRPALPHRITAVVSSIREGDVAATGSAARLLARALPSQR